MPIFILAIITMMLLADAWWWWRADRLLRPLPHGRWLRGVLAVFMIACIGGLGVVIASRFSLELRDAIGPAAIAGLFTWHFIVLPAVAIPSLLIVAANKLVSLAFPPTPDQPAKAQSDDKPGASAPDFYKPGASAPDFIAHNPSKSRSLSRRDLLGAALAAAPPLFTIGGTVRALDQLDEFRIRKLIIPVPGLPADLDRLTIAHVADIHVGVFTRGRTLDRIVEATNSLRADLVLQTGDLINHALSDLPAGIDITRRMQGQFGHFLCEGNHDLIEDRAEFERRALAAGLPLLINRSEEVKVRGTPVQILGLRWGWPAGVPRGDARQGGDDAVNASFGQLLQLRRDDAFPILLAHHPHAFDAAARAGIPLTLAGHTHGGQLHLSANVGFGPLMYRYWSGLYQQNASSLVVSNGVGNWFPLRINAPAEIVHITLRRA